MSDARWDPETVEDALDVLGDVVLWELTPVRWQQIAEILDQLAAAYASGDLEEARAAVADLELSGPVRALRIGSAEVKGIPDPILERRNTLVHELSRRRPAGPDPKDGDGARRPR